MENETQVQSAGVDETGKVDTGMVRVDRNFGTSLLKAAVAKNRERMQNEVVASVQTLLEDVNKQRDLQAQCEANIGVLERKVAAIEGGKFTLDNYGTLVFDDEPLNTEAIMTECCRNCGAPVDGLKSKVGRGRAR